VSIDYTILEKYQVRHTQKQKSEFIGLMQREFPGLRVEKAGKLGSRNLIYGDIERAKVVFTAHYDTVITNLLPNLILPYRPVVRMLYMLLVIAPMVLVMLAVKYGMLALGAGDQLSSVCMLVVYFIMFVGTFLVGIPNRHNANDNTSGVLALVELIGRLTAEELEKTAFVFFDNEEYGCVGSGAFYKQHKEMMQDKLVFNMDCVGDGDNLLFVLTEMADDRWGKAIRAAFTETDDYKVGYADAKKVKYSSDQKHFPVSAALAALHRHKLLKLWVGRIHTGRDTVCSMENIKYICSSACRFIESI